MPHNLESHVYAHVRMRKHKSGITLELTYAEDDTRDMFDFLDKDGGGLVDIERWVEVFADVDTAGELAGGSGSVCLTLIFALVLCHCVCVRLSFCLFVCVCVCVCVCLSLSLSSRALSVCLSLSIGTRTPCS